MAHDLMPEVNREKSYQPLKWSPMHEHICSLHVCGWKNPNIAAETGLSEQYVSIILNDPRGKITIDKLRARVADSIDDVQARLHLLANEAVDEIADELRSSGNEQLRQKAAFGILDRAGYTAIQRKVVAHTSVPESVVQGINAVLAEEREIEATYEIVEAEYKEIEGDLDDDSEWTED